MSSARSTEWSISRRKQSAGNCRGRVFNLPVTILHADHRALQRTLTTFRYIFTNTPESAAAGFISDKWASIADAPIRPLYEITARPRRKAVACQSRELTKLGLVDDRLLNFQSILL